MDHEDFPARVRAERKRRKWTQQELADAADVSLRTVQAFETRKTLPQKENLRSILAVLDIDPDGDDLAARTRSEWPLHVQVFLDTMGAYLMTLPEDVQVQTIHDLTRQIFESRTER